MNTSLNQIFEKFWDGQHLHHLPLLNLQGIDNPHEDQGLPVSLKRIDMLFENHLQAHIIDEIQVLLIREPNWRVHLVLLLATLKLNQEERRLIIPILWERISIGSWVNPQILVVLSLIDGDFKRKAQEITKEEPMAKKTIDAVNYLLNEEALNIDCFTNTEGGAIAKRWKERLLDIMKRGQFQVVDIQT